MRFIAVHEELYEGVECRLQALERNSVKLGFDFLSINSRQYDYSNIPALTESDLLYNAARGSRTLMSLMLNERVTTFYIKNPMLDLYSSTTQFSLLHEKLGFRSPKTIYCLTTNRDLLRRYVEFLGGFPVVLKLAGGSRGVGVMKVESFESLFSVADYLVTTGDEFIMRQYIKSQYGARLIVLGDRVLSCARFFMQPDDFRNAPILSNTRYGKFEPTEELSRMCVMATQAANLEMSGVDVIFDDFGTPYLLEINFPTGFQSFLESVDEVLTEMLLFLKAKAEKKIATV